VVVALAIAASPASIPAYFTSEADFF